MNEDDLAIIDQRVRLGQRRTRASGTVVSRDTTGPRCMVLFDGATVAVPAKVSGTTFVQPGDRCLLDKYGTSDWLVTNSFAATAFGEASRLLVSLPAQTGNLTSATFTDLSEFGTFPFTKNFDATFIDIFATYGAYATIVPTRVIFGVRLTATAGAAGYTPTDTAVGGLNFNTASAHQSGSSFGRIINYPAGTYSVAFRWRRASGTGNVIADTNDTFGLTLDERVRGSVPVL